MNILTQETLETQRIKKQRLDKELSWINREFKDFHTLNDLELDNVERYVTLHLGFIF